MSDREKYRLVFKQSKAVVKDWEAGFFAEFQRKPTRQEISSAPEKVLVSYKNCKKIKLYFEKEEMKRSAEKKSEAENITEPLDKGDVETKGEANLSFSGIFPKIETGGGDGASPACTDISNMRSKVWGQHLNKKVETREISNHAIIGKLSFSSETSTTRSSIKRRGRLGNKSHSFFGSLGDDSTLLGDLSQSSFLDDTQTSFNLEKNVSEPSSILPPDEPLTNEDTMFLEIFPEVQSRISVAPGPRLVARPAASSSRHLDTGWLERCVEIDKSSPALPKPTTVPLTCLVPDISSDPKSKHRTIDPEKSLRTNKTTEPAPDSDKTRLNTEPTTFRGMFSDILSSSSDIIKEHEAQATNRTKPSVKSSPKSSKCSETSVEVPDSVETTKPAKTINPVRTNKPSNEKFDESVENTKPAKKTKPRDKRKRSSTEEEFDPENVPAQKELKVKAVARPARRKPAKKMKEDQNEEEKSNPAPEMEKGPTPLNLFALGFEESTEKPVVKMKVFLTQEQRLASNVASGRANENYKKIDIKKKSYSKGKRTGEFLKKMDYKRKLAHKEGKSIKEYKCYQCGELGHFSRQCTGGSGDKLIPQEMAEDFAVEEFPSLEDAKNMALSSTNSKKSQKVFTTSEGPTVSREINLDDDEEDLLEAVRQYEMSETIQDVQLTTKPYLDLEKFDNRLIYDTLKKFGYDSFRPGQEEGIMRILRGESSLVLLATGSGKSLIYQLPAYLYAEKYNSITIVVSPLVSLMEDQVTGLPPFLRAAALHYNLTPKMKEKVLEQVKSGKLHFLLVSPESVAGGGGVFGSLIQYLPPIAFVCIDEAHCVSQWSHNFRPSYLRLSKVIREKLGVKTILGLTATAPERMICSVAEQLGVPGDGVIRGPLLPNNLTLSVSRDAERDIALLAMLSEEGALGECDSVIVYCTRREECERIATFLRTKLQERDIMLSERRAYKVRMSATSEPYHAGMTPSRRRTVQSHFMSGKLRIVVATVAFGMGIDKSDIRAIVHYNMPKTFESYIQEIGRAGRDGLPARCHLFLGTEGKDLSELKRHIFSNSIDRHTLRKLLHLIFEVSDESENSTIDYKEVALSVDSTIEALDMPEENISTLLCYLESSSFSETEKVPWVRLQNPVYSTCRIQCYGGPIQLRSAASSNPPLAAAIALQRQKGVDFSGASSLEFPVVDVSSRMGWNSGVVKKELKNLEWKSTPSGWKKTGIIVEFSNLAFHFDALQGLAEKQIDKLQNDIFERSRNQEFSELSNLLRLHRAFTLVSFKSQTDATDLVLNERSNKLKEYIASYFSDPEKILDEVKTVPEHCEEEPDIRNSVRAFVGSHVDHTWNGRAVARIFHGIQSPNFPAKQWGRVYKYWRSNLHIDFNILVKIASEEVLRMRTGD